MAFSILLIIALVIIFRSTSNSPPIAESDIVTTHEDVPVSVILTGSDPEGDSLSYVIVAEPSHGSLSGTEPNLIYTPNSNFYGSDSISFKVSDGTAESIAAVVSITVKNINDPVQANDDAVSVKEDVPLVTVEVLANDTDADNDKLILLSASQGSNGSVTINTDNTLAYAPNKNFSGTDSFKYTVSDGKGAMETATVNVTVTPVNDAPRITSKPVNMTRVWGSYTYEVKAKDPDTTDKLIYSLINSPAGMTIDSATGLIEWMPNNAQDGQYDVTVRVEDSNSIPASDTQSFTITVTSLVSPLTTHLSVEKGYNQKSTEQFSEIGEIDAVRAGDNTRIATDFNSYTTYDFSDVSIPAGARIVSVNIYIEHFEEEQFAAGRLQWSVGTGWPDKPVVWTSTVAPVRIGQRNEVIDSLDITGYADNVEKVNTLQLQIKNTNSVARIKTFVDCIYAVVEWY